MGHKKYPIAVLSVLAVGLFALPAFTQVVWNVVFEDMSPYVGQALYLRVVDSASRQEVARETVPEIPADAFTLELPGLIAGASYWIDVFADENGNGRYDAPPVDHAWRFQVNELQEDTALVFVRSTEFTDIGWPPAIDGAISAEEYRGVLIDGQTGMSVYSYVLGELLYIGLRAPGTGWLAIGFEPDRMMQGANIIIGAIEDGELIIEDHHGNTPTSHRKDSLDNIIQAVGSESDGASVLEFVIPLNSGDDEDKMLEAGSEITIILAYHASDDRLTMRHSKRSTTVLLLGE